jgi:SpoIID/LytB domain protein
VGNEPIRVGLTADTTQLRVSPVAGLSVVQSNGTTTALPGGYTGWRLWPTGSGLQLQSTTGGGWSAFAVSGSTNLPSPVRFTAGGNAIRVWRADNTSRDYRGTLSAIASGTTVVTVDTLPIESYLRGVVPQESPASWQPATLQAQAVAARTYAVGRMRAASTAASFDICDTTACQVFGGTAAYTPSWTRTAVEQPSTDAAITATAGVILTYQGVIARTEFSSSSGGWTAPGGTPYLLGKQDPYDSVSSGNASATWQAHLPASALEARYPAVGSLLRLVVTSRNGYGDWGGRVTGARLEGTNGTVTVTGEDLRFARPYPTFSDGLRSSWFAVGRPEPSRVPAVLTAGMSIWSASGGFRLAMQDDGNLVVYDGSGRARWATGTFVGGSSLRVQGDGNVVVVNAHGYGVWESATHAAGSYLVMQDDGNLVLYAPNGAALWDSAGFTGHQGQYLRPPTEVVSLAAGASATSVNGSTRLVMQTDGNLVLYNGAAQPRWASGTFTPSSRAVVQSDGNFVVYRPSGAAAWAARVYSPGAYLVVQDDGNAVLYSTAGTALWDGLGFTGNPGVHPA